jgi:hypothetical protein
LLAPDGTVVARLRPGGKPRPVTDLIGTLQQPPTLDPATVEKLRSVPQALPPRMTPATDRTIVGTWTPTPSQTSPSGKRPFLEFDADGGWKSYDGCNGGGGRWVLGSAGEFLTTMGATAGVGCAGPVTDIRVADVRRAAVTDGVLTLYGADGKLIARLTR